jgi:UDP-2,3-diacylglucosamine pyrophosphatase LpxH
MRIAAISDFHIGSTDRVDCFRHEPREFHRFLDQLEATHDRIVLLGDIFQSEYGPWLGARTETEELRAAQKRVPDLWKRFQGHGYDYLHGNHDAVSATVCGAMTDLRISDEGFVVYFIHGHQFDPLFQRLYPVARVSTWFSGRVRRVGLRPFADWLEHKDVAIKHRRFQGRTGPYAGAARDLLRSQGADAVVMGHTHVPQHLSLSEGIYANTGTCSQGQYMFTSIDTRRRTVECLRGAQNVRR